jgi:hypothetical protein
MCALVLRVLMGLNCMDGLITQRAYVSILVSVV